jgi:hypothetical protein
MRKFKRIKTGDRRRDFFWFSGLSSALLQISRWCLRGRKFYSGTVLETYCFAKVILIKLLDEFKRNLTIQEEIHFQILFSYLDSVQVKVLYASCLFFSCSTDRTLGCSNFPACHVTMHSGQIKRKFWATSGNSDHLVRERQSGFPLLGLKENFGPSRDDAGGPRPEGPGG